MEHRMAFVNEVEKHLKKELAGFDPLVYKVPGRPTISPKYHKIELGKTAALIGRLVAMGASELELIRAVKYFKVVLNALKHNLEWRQVGLDMGIKDLAKKYSDK